MLPLVCNDAVALLFMFDLSRKSTLNSIKEWYRQARGFNKVRLRFLPLMELSWTNAVLGGHADAYPALLSVRPRAAQTAIPFLVGTKYDHFSTFSQDEQEEITRQVRPASDQRHPVQPADPRRNGQARRFSRAMKAPLIFCSTSHSINVQKIFKIVLSKVRRDEGSDGGPGARC